MTRAMKPSEIIAAFCAVVERKSVTLAAFREAREFSSMPSIILTKRHLIAAFKRAEALAKKEGR